VNVGVDDRYRGGKRFADSAGCPSAGDRRSKFKKFTSLHARLLSSRNSSHATLTEEML
jgi:hypothetical protein